MHDFLKPAARPDIFSENICVSACEFYSDQYQDSLYEAYNIPFNQVSTRAVTKRKAEFLAGRHCANLCLKNYGILDFVIKSGEKRDPQWPANIVGAISHSNTYAIAITGSTSSYLGIGVDVENLVTKETAIRLKSQIFTPAEDTQYAHQVNFHQVFTICFSLKESFFKAVYPLVRKYFDFSDVTVKKIKWTNEQTGIINLCLNRDLCEHFQSGQVFAGKFCKRNDQVITSVEIRVD